MQETSLLHVELKKEIWKANGLKNDTFVKLHPIAGTQKWAKISSGAMYIPCSVRQRSKFGYENCILGSVVNLTKPPAGIINSMLL